MKRPTDATTLGTLLSIVMAAAALGIPACSQSSLAGSGTACDDDSGSVVAALQLAPGVTIDSAAYTINGPGGFSKTGTINVAHSNTLSVTIPGLPAGGGFTLSISATSTDGSTTCGGSAPLGGAIALAVAAHDSDAGPTALSYRWTADAGGTLGNASSATPTFACVGPGSVTISVTVSDGDSTPGCADSGSVQVRCSLPGAGSTAASTMAVYGDAPYGTTPTDNSQTVATPAFIASVNADPDVSMVLHVGDIHSGKQFCTQGYDQTIFDLWTAYLDPLIYTPGDNEWTDCHKAAEGGGSYNATTMAIDYVLDGMGNPVDYAKGDPMANLALVRSLFFPTPGQSLGTNKIPLLSQAQFFDRAHPGDAAFVENVMWEKSNVLFVAINVPGGSNNDQDVWYGAPAPTPAQTQEAADRTGADLRWLDLAFAQAQADGVAAVVIEAQADMWDPEKGAAHQAGYEPIVMNLASHTTTLGKPVLMFNGDSHVYQTGNPMDPTNPVYPMHPGYNVPNFYRIVVHGSTTPLEWLKVTIDPSANAPAGANAFGPFAWTRMIQP